MANYQAARALMGKGNSELRRSAGEGAAGLSNSSSAMSVRERGSSAKKGVKKSAVKKTKPIKGTTLTNHL
jgi:hypothetical protein